MEYIILTGLEKLHLVNLSGFKPIQNTHDKSPHKSKLFPGGKISNLPRHHAGHHRRQGGHWTSDIRYRISFHYGLLH
jgi:hypothetical protein